MKRGWLRLHRRLGIGVLVFWLLQALTGTLLVYRWEIEDALLPGSAAPADPAGLGARLEDIAKNGGRAVDVWASADAATRFDVYYVDAAGAPRILRVDGRGNALRDAPDTGRFANGAFFDTLTEFHVKLLAGQPGSWIVSLSGILLLVQLVVGLKLAWPRVGHWRRALFTRPRGTGAALAHGWHRTLGLWLGIVILPFVAAGIGLSFEHGLRERIAQEIPAPVADAAPVRVGPAAALAIAAARRPGSKLSALVLPTADAPWYQVRQRRPGEIRRNWGTSTMFVSATDGRVLADYDAADAPAGRRLMDTLHPFHTGQFAGAAGRSLVLLQGLWLAAMIILGMQLWWKRRAHG